MWLVIEVVPKATPLLLSIETMRHLGTVIGLQKGSCFLKALDRNIQSQKGKTGLLMIQVRDLWQPSSEFQSNFGASTDLSAQVHFVEPHAQSRRDDADGEERRERAPESPDSDDPAAIHPARINLATFSV